jgi:hypothetical protein
MAAPPTMSTGVYKVRTQATYQSRYQKHLNSSSTLPLLSRSASPFRRPCSPADEVIELVATSVVGRYCCKSVFWNDERKFSEPLTRFARSDVRDHIISFKIDHGPPYLRRKATQQQRRPKVNFGEIFGFARFSTFATISATNGLMHRSKLYSITSSARTSSEEHSQRAITSPYRS